jgi:uncharacterized protein YndB with AHSA1/START domain
MPPAAHGLAPADFAVDRETNILRFTRRLAGAPEQVFAAWTDPRQVELWWDPAGEKLSRCDIDLRVGGAFTFVGRSHPEMPFSGVYRELAPPSRLVFDAMGAVGRVALTPADDEGTLMVVEIACASAEHLQQFVDKGVADGTSRTLDNLVMHVGRRSAAAAE